MTERERIQKVIETEDMTAKQFAEEVGIQASTLSNILGGRNNPSLDVMQKVLTRFRTLSSDWLILGIGSMYKQKLDSQPTLFDLRPETPITSEKSVTVESTDSTLHTQPIQNKVVEQPVVLQNRQKKITNILVFYDDNTFEEVSNRL